MVNRGMTSGDPAPRGDLKQEMRLLGSVPSFSHAPSAVLKALVTSGYVVQVRPQWTLLAERTAPERAYVLLDGTVDVHRGSTDLGPCRPGEILGELGIVRHRLRSATVVTHEPATVLSLSRAAFEEVRAQHPYFRDLVGDAVLRKAG